MTFRRMVDRIVTWFGSSFALAAAALLVVVWLAGIPVFGLTDTYQLIINTVTTVVTFLMVFVIQNGQNRNDKALHTKIDGIIAVLYTDNKLTQIENMSEKEIDALHEENVNDHS